MKEQTYGWYPSVRDIYLSKNQPTPYHLECLYKFRDSGYHNPKLDPPPPAFIIRGISPSPGPASASSTRSTQQCASRFGVPPIIKKSGPIPTPNLAWKSSPKETEWGYPQPQPPSKPASASSSASHKAKCGSTVKWPSQELMGKYDKPYRSLAGDAEEAERRITGEEPVQASQVGGSGFVFVPSGDGTKQIHSPPVYWPDTHPYEDHPLQSPIQPDPTSNLHHDSAQQPGGLDKLEAGYYEKCAVSAPAPPCGRAKSAGVHRHTTQAVQRPVQSARSSTYGVKVKMPPRPVQSAKASISGGKMKIPSQSTKVSTSGDKTKIFQHSTKPSYGGDKTKIPARPVQSARAYSYGDGVKVSQSARPSTAAYGDRSLQATPGVDKEAVPSPLPRPPNPVPVSPSPEHQNQRCYSADNQELLELYGWRAQVHGDPYNLKKTVPRLSYTVKCTEPVLEPEPPKVHMESRETFFMNTIPRQRATFDVHQDWMSEGLHAQRLKLQQRHGLNYRYKTFSFAY